MATTRNLSLTFLDTNDEKYSQTWRNVKSSLTAQEVQTFGAAVITNGAIFSKTPASLGSATLTTTTTREIDISD